MENMEMLDLKNMPDSVALEAEIGRRSLFEFSKLIWPQIEPATTYFPNWHIGAICEHLQAVIAGEISNIVISIPPGCMKTLICSVIFQAWGWIDHPQVKFLNGSFSDPNMKRDAKKVMGILESPYFRERWRGSFNPVKTDWNIRKFSNDKGGFRLYTTVKGGITGEHAHIHIIDDPNKAQEGKGVEPLALAESIEWYKSTMSTRFASGFHNARVLIMQRLHEMDLAGYILKEYANAEHLMLPHEFEPSRKCYTSIGFEDPRTEPGELLFPDRFPAEKVKQLRKDLGEAAYQAQAQQNPTPSEGSIIKAAWTKKTASRLTLPKDGLWIQSWDCTFKDEVTSDYVAGQVWVRSGSNAYLVDQIRERMDIVDTLRAVEEFSKKWPQTHTKLIEDKANGTAVIRLLKDRVPGILPVPVDGGKASRLSATAPFWQAGNVLVCDEVPGKDIFISETTGFPNRPHDDTMDAGSQALNYLFGDQVDILVAAMENSTLKALW